MRDLGNIIRTIIFLGMLGLTVATACGIMKMHADAKRGLKQIIIESSRIKW